MPPTGEGRRRVLIVAEAPGKEEDAQGEQLIGPAGQHLRGTLGPLGVNLDRDCWKTNAIICRPKDNRTPTNAEVDYCRPNVNKAIRDLNPEVIIPMGLPAVRSVIGPLWKEDPGKMGRWVGWQIPSQKLNAWVCPTWHPSYLLRTGGKYDKSMNDNEVLARMYEEQLEAAFDLEGRPWGDSVPDWRADVRCTLDAEQAARWLQRVAQAREGMVAFDYETNMLKPDSPDARIVSASVAWGRTEPERTFAFPWHGPAIKAFQQLMRSPIPKIASNMKFEDRWTRMAFGHRVRGWYWDTMLASHVADCRPEITGLKFQAFVLLGMPSFNDHIEPFLKTKGNTKINQVLKQIDMDDLLLYNGLDSLLEFRVAVKQMAALNYPLPWET